ncbi:MAG: hypothetical protein M3N08_06305 [Pseudomonadota bacterium]|nr:hypothetical protein [Pseudomonadota bacterium]
MKWTGISSCVTRRRLRSSAGFSLTELAIVLGVIGLILGGVWTVAGQGREKARQTQLTQDMLLVVKNVRAAFAGQNGLSGAVTTITPQLIFQGAIPNDMVRNGGCTSVYAGQPYCADHPWGASPATVASGSFVICPWRYNGDTACAANVPTSQQTFAVELRGLPQESCIKIATLNSGAGSPSGLVDVVINTKSVVNSAGVTHQFPVKSTDASVICTNNSTIDFVYRIVTPQS